MNWCVRLSAAAALALVLTAGAGAAEVKAGSVPPDLDLAGPFRTTTPWRLLAHQGAQAYDETMDEVVPGEVSLCLAKRAGGPCAVELPAMAKPPPPLAPDAWAAHYLDRGEIVWPHGKSARPLLLLRTSSLPSGNGDQAVFTQLFAYRRAADRFQQVYGKMTGRNRNEEVRYVEAGPLAGAVIAAEPTSDAPYGYWIEVSRLTASYMYRPVLRYRSATRYGDGNSLAVIDSEMPAILQRLGLWRMGSPLPLPKGRCLHPSLVKHELWCEPRPAMAGG